MAPSLSTATGILPSIADNPQLVQLRHDANQLKVGQVEELCELLRGHTEWSFEEQVDLYEWIGFLNVVDASLRGYITEYPALLLVTRDDVETETLVSFEQVQQVPEWVTERVEIMLQFLVNMLQNSCSKSVFNSVDELVDFLAAAKDSIADLALRALQALSAPPLMHKQQTPEVHQHGTAIHTAKTCHSRVLNLMRGWGARSQGLGLLDMVSADDSVHGQGQLPVEAGHVKFGFLSPEGKAITIEMTETEIALSASIESSPSASKKRRIGGCGSETRSTVELFFLAAEKVGGRHQIPSARAFALLTDIRLARGFYSQSARVEGVERRLRAISTLLHAQPRQDIIGNFFSAQPELTVEIMDLLRPMVSSANVSSVSSVPTTSSLPLDAISGLSSSDLVPYEIRLAALDTITALVSRRDGASSGTSGAGRLSTLLNELGVGKGQYLGLLPTLIRYSLAPLTMIPPNDKMESADMDVGNSTSPSMELGLAFMEMVREPRPPRVIQVERAFALVEKVLTLASTVVSTSPGTSALTDCGLVPTLLRTLPLRPDDILQRLLPNLSELSETVISRQRAFLRFVTAQAVQILESAVVSHSNVLSSFHELRGMEILTARLSEEICTVCVGEGSLDVEDDQNRINLSSSQRVLLFSIVTCTAVIFHKQSTASATASSVLSSSEIIKSEGLTRAFINIMEDAEYYGGHLTSLTATLLSDVMNSDPHIVKYVHESGIAKAFLDLLAGRAVKDANGNADFEPLLPAVPEMMMAVPNVIAALSLTDDGAKAVLEANPFPSLLRIFYHPGYVMPRSRCLLNEMAAIVGTGFDEIMRHVERLKTAVVEAIVGALRRVVEYAEDLRRRELVCSGSSGGDDLLLDDERSCLIQYSLNITQMLDQILQNEENIHLFVLAGVLEPLLDLFPAALPAGCHLLSHISGLSAPSMSTLHHSTIEESVSVVLRCLTFKFHPAKMLETISSRILEHHDSFKKCRSTLTSYSGVEFCLDGAPKEPIYLAPTKTCVDFSELLSAFANVNWLTSLLSLVISAATQRSQEGEWSRTEDKLWKQFLCSEEFSCVLDTLSSFHSSCLFEVCRARTMDGYEESERQRQVQKSLGVAFRIRIVCSEGAVVRDGIDIDSCANIGSMEMGEISESSDRCINSSGILRYKTSRGWVSEMTRGQSREPIAEVISVSFDPNLKTEVSDKLDRGRKELSVPGIRTLASGVLAKIQWTYSELISTLSKVVFQWTRDMDTRSSTRERDSENGFISVMTRQLSKNIAEGFQHKEVVLSTEKGQEGLYSGVALYLGCLVRDVNSYLFDEKRERWILNFPLLLNLLFSDNIGSTCFYPCERLGQQFGFMDAVTYIFEYCLSVGFQRHGSQEDHSNRTAPVQQLSRVVAASLPQAISLLRRLVGAPLSSSPVISVMSRVTWKDLLWTIGLDDFSAAFSKSEEQKEFFQPERLWNAFQVLFSSTIRHFWSDSRFEKAPAHILHPVTRLILDSFVALEDLSSKKGTLIGSTVPQSGGTRLRDLIREREEVVPPRDTFEATEESIQSLIDMGFSRSVALDAIENSQSNQTEVAMEYALSHPPPSPASAQRRMERREARARDSVERIIFGSRNSSTSEPSRLESEESQTRTDASQPGAMEEDSDNPTGEEHVDLIRSSKEKWLESVAAGSVGILLQAARSDEPTMVSGNADSEAKATVLSSFLLDICRRYPEAKEGIVSNFLDRLKEALSETSGHGPLKLRNEAMIGTLCHSLVFFARAVSDVRLLILERGIMLPLVEFVGSVVNEEPMPSWIAPPLLLLGTMSLPSVAFTSEDLQGIEHDSSVTSDLDVVKRQHLSQVKTIAEFSRQAFSGGDKSPGPKENDLSSVFGSIPPYHTLLPPDCEKACLVLCNKVLRKKSENAVPPGILHATLSLYFRLNRSPTIVQSQPKLDVAVSILDLPKESRFEGNTGIISSIFRRLLEDRKTLKAAMETEIRNIIIKSSSGREPATSMGLPEFFKAATPLIYREPEVCLHAMALSVKIEKDDGNSPVVRLLPNIERDAIALRSEKAGDHGKRSRSSTTKEKVRSKSHRRRSTSKKLQKKDSTEQRHSTTPNESAPGTAIASVLISRIIESTLDSSSGENRFLRSTDLMTILADLVLTVPACASAVHNYRPSKDKNSTLATPSVDHALREAPAPPKTFVNYLLHRVLPQRRWDVQQDRQLWESKDHKHDPKWTAKLERSRNIILLSQSAARLIVALVARPGEGRKRTIADLSFALSGGFFGHGDASLDVISTPSEDPLELHALSAWGELCLGLAVPRSQGKNVPANPSLSIDIIKIMIEQGVPHALLHALHRAPLHHPMAPSTCSMLLLPLELFTRTNVVDRISASVKQNTTKTDTTTEKTKPSDAGMNNQGEPPINPAPDFGLVVSNETSGDNRSTDEEMDGQMSVSDGSASESSSSVDSLESDSSDDADEDDMSSVIEDDDEEVSSSEVQEEGEWDVDYHNGMVDIGEVDGDSPDSDPDGEDGWLRIESRRGFPGGMIREGGSPPSRQQGLRNAAESMIGSLLRTGELTQGAIAELEGTLGINIHSRLRQMNIPTNSTERREASGQDGTSTVVGTMPQVNQRSQTDQGPGSFSMDPRRATHSSMELVYGGPAVSSGVDYYDTISPRNGANSQVQPLGLSDRLVFPDGSYAAALPRTQHCIHPLLSSINLPPVNALVSDILPHGLRSRRRGQSSRRSGDWNSSSLIPAFGSALSNPTSTGRSAGNNSNSIGWPDDGAPFDRTIERFRSALQAALAAQSTLPNASPVPENLTGEMPLEQEPQDSPSDAVRSSVGVDSEPSSIGEAVASSLASGLRLSPSSTGGSPDAEAEENPGDTTVTGQSGDDARERSDETVEREHTTADTANESGETNPPSEELNMDSQADGEPAGDGDRLSCPPGIDSEVFDSLPREMQQDCVDQYNATMQLNADLNGTSLDPEALAALPADLRDEVLAQERRRLEADAPADPSQAEDMDNASFLASLAPDLREEILLTADEEFLSSLPPGIVAEAQILRERHSARHRGLQQEVLRENAAAPSSAPQDSGPGRKRQKNGMIRVEVNRNEVVASKSGSPIVASSDVKALLRLLYLSNSVEPPALIQKILSNLCVNENLRSVVLASMIAILHGDANELSGSLDWYKNTYEASEKWRPFVDKQFTGEFPPASLIEIVHKSEIETYHPSLSSAFRSASVQAVEENEPSDCTGAVPPAVSTRVLDIIQQLIKVSPRVALHCVSRSLPSSASNDVCFERLLDLVGHPSYSLSSTNLEQLLTLLEACVAPLSHLSRSEEATAVLSEDDRNSALASGKEWLEVPHILVSQHRLKLLCSVLRLEACRDGSFARVNTIIRRLCRVKSNRGFVLGELATVARALGGDALLDLKALRIRMESAASRIDESTDNTNDPGALGAISGSVAISITAGELKLFRVLQTLQALCASGLDESTTRRSDGHFLVTQDLVGLLRRMKLEDLWEELTACMKVVLMLEGVRSDSDKESKEEEMADDASGDGREKPKKILRNNAAGLLTRFLPVIEAFFVAKGSCTRPLEQATDTMDPSLEDMVDGPGVIKFVSENRILLNALVRNNSSLLDKGFRALVYVPRCRVFLDFDVKRHWFKTQVRRLRSQASRRHGSLRLHIRRKHVFEDAYHQLRLRNADEMRGRLHITFRDESGVDAGGLSREFFGILAKEMFNPNYALFTSTEDGCTFQPNPNSSINPDHLSYFRFVGRIVGKAVSDGYLLDAHFTRSLYKHMLGLDPTHHDMEAIDQDYYRNLKTILEYNLQDIGLELTFSVEDHSFGRNQIVDLIPDGRRIMVTEDNKENYVQKVCQHRMTTAIQNQIKAYLDGFYELVSPDLIGVFTPGELELLISGLPDIDVGDLKKNTDYVGWKATDKQIEWFWNLLFSLSRNEKATFLQFVTGSSKVPLTGFADLPGMRGVQKFSIHKVTGKKGSLMAAHTCFNSLDFPEYDSEEELKEKVLLAINEGSGSFMIA